MYWIKYAALRRSLAITLLAAGTGGSIMAQDLSTPLPADPNVVTGKFPNGLTYYVRTNKKPANKVELRLVVKAGSILEDNDQLGLAHFMEHMNFNGLQHFQKNELVSYLQSIGVEFGADLNAYTAFDQTVYILPIPTDKPGNLEKGFQIIEDWSHNASLTDKDIDEERAVVLEESRLGKGAEMRMLGKYFPRATSGSLYASRLPIGKDEVLKSFKYETIRRYYHDWYRPDLQAVAVVGDIDTGTAMRYLREHFASIPNPSGEKPRAYVDVTPRQKPEAMVVTDKEATNNSLMILFPYMKQKDQKTIGDYRDAVKRALVLQMINRRLSDLANGSNPPFPFAGVEFDDMIHGYEAFTASTSFGNESPQKAMDALVAELLRVKQYGFTESELELAKKSMLNSMDKSYKERKTTDSRTYVEEYIRNFLQDEPFPGIENEYTYYQQMLPGMQLAELNSLPREWMSNSNTFTLITGPEKQSNKLPTDAALLAMSAKAFKQAVKPIEEKKIASSLMATLPTPGKVVNREEMQDLGATTYTLSNGMKVTIKPTDFKSDEIVLKGMRRGGKNNYPAADQNNAQYAPDVVDAMGIGGFSPTDLQKILSGRTAKVGMSIGDIQDAVSGNSSVKDFETMLQLLHLYMTAPRTDPALYQAYVDKQKQMLMFISANPQVAYFDTTIKTLYHNSPFAPKIVPGSRDFESMSMTRALAIYKSEFGSADGYQFFLVGNIDPQTAIPLIERYLGSIPASGKPAAFKDNGMRAITGQTRLNVKRGKEKQSMIFANYYGQAPWSEELSLRAQAVAEVLNIKVIEDLREKMGGIYTGGFYAQVSREPYNRYAVVMQLPCGPENVDKLLAAAAGEIKDLKEKGPDAKDLDKVKSQWREAYRTKIKENGYWSDKLSEILFLGRDKTHTLQYEQWIDALTPADVQQTAKALFDGKNEFISVLYPES